MAITAVRPAVGLFRIGVVVVGLALPGSVAAGCGSSCQASCVGPRADIHVSNEIAENEVCDDAGTCTRQSFGPTGEAASVGV